MIISLIAAVAENRVIGKDNDLLWRLPKDIRFFMNTTIGHHVITGRKNYESIPPGFRPLKDRTNIVVTNQQTYETPGAEIVHTLEEGVELARKNGETELFIIGGGQIYSQFMNMADRLYITEVKAAFDGDTFFPSYNDSNWTEVSRVNNFPDDHHTYQFDFVVYHKKSG